MKLSLNLQQTYTSNDLILKSGDVKNVIDCTLGYMQLNANYELGIACVDCEESQRLNSEYRGKDKPTNVLSFPSDIPESIIHLLDAQPLGDLVICIPVIIQEATDQNKSINAHFTHMLVHGTLHLLGYDHETSDENAERMEMLEIEILSQLGLDNPYFIN